jgi:hypothetical protein
MKPTAIFALTILLIFTIYQAPAAQAGFIETIGYNIDLLTQKPIIAIACS